MVVIHVQGRSWSLGRRSSTFGVDKAAKVQQIDGAAGVAIFHGRLIIVCVGVLGSRWTVHLVLRLVLISQGTLPF